MQDCSAAAAACASTAADGDRLVALAGPPPRSQQVRRGATLHGRHLTPARLIVSTARYIYLCYGELHSPPPRSAVRSSALCACQVHSDDLVG
ncbi:hypothetical protein BDA96_10G353400 [Sorghum bicolor]|uniref:Uncharacterized protein n=1 Tax=Sorghum bicolor TaxID=4558 RepID=A0A921Q8T5_SORBI|nr:hypothetical protein BDA96_10G353400 [Sorghum bicolor]